MTQDLFFDQPYSDRQLVLFMDAAAIAAMKKVSEEKKSKRNRAKERLASFMDVSKVTKAKETNGYLAEEKVEESNRHLAEKIASAITGRLAGTVVVPGALLQQERQYLREP